LFDVEAAKKVGMMAIWKRNDAWLDVEADYIIDNLREIQEVLKALQNT